MSCQELGGVKEECTKGKEETMCKLRDHYVQILWGQNMMCFLLT